MEEAEVGSPVLEKGFLWPGRSGKTTVPTFCPFGPGSSQEAEGARPEPVSTQIWQVLHLNSWRLG